MGFADGAISVIGDRGFGDKPDMVAVTGDESGNGPGFLGIGARVHLRFSCVLGPVSGVVIDILPKRASNEDTSTLRLVNCLSFLAGGVSLN